MKLHLPKALLSMVLAVCAAQTVQAAWVLNDEKNDIDNGVIIYYTNEDDSVLDKSSDETGIAAACTDIRIAPEFPNQTHEFTNAYIADGDKLSIIANPWVGDEGVRNFSLLTVDSLTVGDGTGKATIVVDANQSLELNELNGAINTLTVNGNLTLGFDYTFTSAGQVTGAGTLVIGDGANVKVTLADSGDAAIQSNIRIDGGGTLTVSNKDGMGWGQGYKYAPRIELKGTSAEKTANLVLSATQTLGTNITMSGYATISGSDVAINPRVNNGITISVSGTENEISAGLFMRSSATFNIAKDADLKITGKVSFHEKGDQPGGNNGYEKGSLIKKGEGKITFSNASNVFEKKYFHEAGETVIAAAAEFKDGIRVTGGEFTLNADITLGSGKIIELAGGTLNLGGSLSNNQAVQFLTGITGSGNITINKDITLGNGSSSHAEGKLTVQNATLTMGGNKGHNVVINSFNYITLDGGTIKVNAASTEFKNVTITANGGTLKVDDMQDSRSPHLLSGVTTIEKEGTFTLETSWWRQNTNIALLTGEGNLVIKDSFTSSNKADDTVINISELKNFSGGITVDAGTDGVTKLNVTAGEGVNLKGVTLSGSNMTLKAGNMTVDGNLNMGLSSTITLDKDSTINLGSTVSVKGVSSEDTKKAQIVRRTDDGDSQVKGDKYDTRNTEYSIKNAHLTVTSGSDIDVSNHLSNTAVTNNGTGTVNLVFGKSDRSEVNALKGNINMMWMSDNNGRTDVLTKLEVADNLTIAAQVGGSAITDITKADLSTLEVTQTAIFGSNATVKANLTLTSGATLTLNGYGEENAATITGTLKLGTELKLEGSVVKAIEEMQVDDKLLLLKADKVIFGEVDAAAFGEYADLSVAADAIVKATPLLESVVNAQAYFSSLNVENYKLLFENGALYIQYVNPIPEPTTATLSLLALAALASRRRRK